MGTLNVLESAVHHKVKKVVAGILSFCLRDPSYLPMDEGHPFNNRTLYGAGKVANEQMLRALLRNVQVALCSFPLLQYLRTTYGHRWRLHRGLDSLDGRY